MAKKKTTAQAPVLPQAPILANLERADAAGVDIVLRCPLIPGINMNEDHYKAIAATADKYPHIIRVDLEPYHTLGTGKLSRLGKEEGFVTDMPEKDQMEEIRRQIESMCTKPVAVS